MPIDQIARAECAQFLFREGFDLSTLGRDSETRVLAAQHLASTSNLSSDDAMTMVDAIAERY